MCLGGLATHLLHLSSLIPPQLPNRFSHISNMPTLQDSKIVAHTLQDIMIIMAEGAPHIISCKSGYKQNTNCLFLG